MKIKYSKHWLRKHQKKKKDITNDAIEYTIKNSRVMNDRNWKEAFNAISRIPPSGRILKVVYKKTNEKVFITPRFVLSLSANLGCAQECKIKEHS